MSADNYYYIFKRDGKYVVQCRFASCEYDESDLGGHGKVFDTLDEANDYAYEEYSEYGVVHAFKTRVVESE